jgi:hypothetical protein
LGTSAPNLFSDGLAISSLNRNHRRVCRVCRDVRVVCVVCVVLCRVPCVVCVVQGGHAVECGGAGRVRIRPRAQVHRGLLRVAQEIRQTRSVCTPPPRQTSRHSFSRE